MRPQYKIIFCLCCKSQILINKSNNTNNSLLKQLTDLINENKQLKAENKPAGGTVVVAGTTNVVKQGDKTTVIVAENKPDTPSFERKQVLTR